MNRQKLIRAPVRSQELSPRMLRARVACRQAQAHLDAMDGDPAKRAWAEVMDALYEMVKCDSPLPP